MAKKIKIRAKASGDGATVKCLMSHPMETGLRKDKKTGEVIPRTSSRRWFASGRTRRS